MWSVRREGAPRAAELASAQAVLTGLADGLWEPTDEVRGPGETRWRPLEDHPTFADAVADLEEPPHAPHDDSNLDMNPLIDVALVLLIFFILTTTYESLRRSIDLPPEPQEKQGPTTVVQKKDIEDRTFEVAIRMERGEPSVTVAGAPVALRELADKVAEVVRTTGRRELYAKVDEAVPWGVEAKLYDAAKGAGVTQIYWPKGK